MVFLVVDSSTGDLACHLSPTRGHYNIPATQPLLKHTLVVVRWGELQARAEQRGRLRPVNDPWITACCLVRNLPLATLNLKDFKDFADHDGLRVIGVNER